MHETDPEHLRHHPCSSPTTWPARVAPAAAAGRGRTQATRSGAGRAHARTPTLGGRGRFRPRRSPQGALSRARPLRHRRGRGGSERGERPARQGAPARLLPPSPPLGGGGGAAGLPRSSSHGARPAGGTALLPSRQPLRGTRRGRRGLPAAGRQVGAGGAPEGKLGSGRQRSGRAGLCRPGRWCRLRREASAVRCGRW